MIWVSVVIDTKLIIALLYYYKLGLGLSSYYLPYIYYNYLSTHHLLVYIGITNILLMFVGIYNIELPHPYLVYSQIIILFILIQQWIYYGLLYLHQWLYGISISTIILATLYYLLINKVKKYDKTLKFLICISE